MKRLAMALFVVAAVAVVGVVPAAADAACEQACQDTLDADVQACDDELASDNAGLDADEADCANKSNPDACLNSVAKRRRNAIRQHENCLRVADIQYDNCIKDCDESPAEKR